MVKHSLPHMSKTFHTNTQLQPYKWYLHWCQLLSQTNNHIHLCYNHEIQSP
jgi:hypothetical protein